MKSVSEDTEPRPQAQPASQAGMEEFNIAIRAEGTQEPRPQAQPHQDYSGVVVAKPTPRLAGYCKVYGRKEPDVRGVLSCSSRWVDG